MGVYGGVTAQDRVARRRRLLLDAGLDALGTEGWPAMTVRGVCQRARLTPRFFYESFADIDELAVAVFDEVAARASALVFEALAGSTGAHPHTRARAGLGAFIRHVTDDPRRVRVALVAPHGSVALAARRSAAMKELARTIAGQAREVYGSTNDGLLEVTATVLAGGLAELLVAWVDEELPIGIDELVEDFCAVFIATGEAAAAVGASRLA